MRNLLILIGAVCLSIGNLNVNRSVNSINELSTKTNGAYKVNAHCLTLNDVTTLTDNSGSVVAYSNYTCPISYGEAIVNVAGENITLVRFIPITQSKSNRIKIIKTFSYPDGNYAKTSNGELIKIHESLGNSNYGIMSNKGFIQL